MLYPFCPLRMALTTSFTPILTFLSFAAFFVKRRSFFDIFAVASGLAITAQWFRVKVDMIALY